MNTRYFTSDQVDRYGVNEGDLVVVKSSGSAASIQSGKMILVDHALAGSFLFSNFLMRLRPKTVYPPYLYYFLTSSRIKKMLPSLCEASTYPNIRIPEYLEIQVPLPSIEEQIAIASILSDMDSEIDSLESKLAKAREIKQGMMQELLTGKTRLV
jgi:type I restriction enzyme S subunit